MPRERMIEYGGRTQSLSGWARELGVNPATLKRRLDKMTIEEALTTPFKEWREIDQVRLLTSLKAGHRPQQIAREMGISVMSVYLGRKKYGMQARVDKERACELFKQGVPRKEILKEIRCSSVYLGKILSEAGLTLPAPKSRIIEFNGKSQTVSAWARELGVRPQALFKRLYSGMPPEQALALPFKKYKPRTGGES